MFFASLFFLGLAICIFAALVCFTLAKFVKWESSHQSSPEQTAAWNHIKAAIKLYSQYQPEESTTQKSLRSWTGTLVICAGLCMIGILLEVDFNKPITPDSVVSGLVTTPRISNLKKIAPQRAKNPSAAKSTPAEPSAPAPTK